MRYKGREFLRVFLAPGLALFLAASAGYTAEGVIVFGQGGNSQGQNDNSQGEDEDSQGGRRPNGRPPGENLPGEELPGEETPGQEPPDVEPPIEEPPIEELPDEEPPTEELPIKPTPTPAQSRPQYNTDESDFITPMPTSDSAIEGATPAAYPTVPMPMIILEDAEQEPAPTPYPIAPMPLPAPEDAVIPMSVSEDITTPEAVSAAPEQTASETAISPKTGDASVLLLFGALAMAAAAAFMNGKRFRD